MEKIALKNTQQGSPNTYELSTRQKRQLIESSGAYRRIDGLEEVNFYVSGQIQKDGSGYDFPFRIFVHEFVLYFAQGNAESMRFTIGALIEDFNAPIGAGVVVITPIEPVAIQSLRMRLRNLETSASASPPVLSSWCFTYSRE